MQTIPIERTDGRFVAGMDELTQQRAGRERSAVADARIGVQGGARRVHLDGRDGRAGGGSRRTKKEIQRVQDAGDRRGLVVEQMRPVQLDRLRGTVRIENIEHILRGRVGHRLRVRNPCFCHCGLLCIDGSVGVHFLGGLKDRDFLLSDQNLLDTSGTGRRDPLDDAFMPVGVGCL